MLREKLFRWTFPSCVKAKNLNTVDPAKCDYNNNDLTQEERNETLDPYYDHSETHQEYNLIYINDLTLTLKVETSEEE